MYLWLAGQLSGTQQNESPGMNQYHEWPYEYSPLSESCDLKLTCSLAFTFVMADFLVAKPCRPPKCLLVYALNITVNDYFFFYWVLTFTSS